MKIWSMKVIILLLFCYACLSTGNGKVHFVSRNFNNTLHWDPVEPSFPEENLVYMYSVEYKNDADKQEYQIKAGCQNITALSCDLTAETPSVHDVHYWARVLVNGRLHGLTKFRFKPLAHTIFGPPTLSIYTTVSSLHANVTLPLGPDRVSVGDIIASSKNGPYKTVIWYTLHITHPKWAEQEHENTTGQFVINLKNNKTEYCGYVAYTPSSEWGRIRSENASFCVTLKGDPLMLLPWLLITAASLLAIVMMSVVCMCNYVKGGKELSMPQKLATTSTISPRVLQHADPNLKISKLALCPQSDKKVYATTRVKPNVPSVGVGGYISQDIPCQAWQDSTDSSVDTYSHSPTPNPEDTSAQSSEIYSVVAVHVPTEEKDFQQATMKDTETSNLPLFSSGEIWDRGTMSPKLSSHGVPPLSVPDTFDSNPDRPLLLHAVRDSNGKLLLPSLTFQLQSCTGDPQRKPLLLDIIDSAASSQSLDSSDWSDSGCDENTLNTPTQPYCNSHYFPSQPVVSNFNQGCLNTPASDDIFESGYKQNWMPAILLETASKQSCEYRSANYPCTWSGLKKEEEGEDEDDIGGEEISGPREIILGDWVVQIQE